MRRPGLEPGSPRWQRDILTTVLPALTSLRKEGYLNY